MTQLLVHFEGDGPALWRAAFAAADPALDVKFLPDWGEDATPCYLFGWGVPTGALAGKTGLKAILSGGAGVDLIFRDGSLPDDLPVIRLADDGLIGGMVEFIVMAVLAHHRRLTGYVDQSRRAHWQRLGVKPATDTRVGFLGYGNMVRGAARTLKTMGYDLAAWSRTEKKAEAGLTHYQGAEGLAPFLRRTDILVGVLPSTPETAGLVNADTLALLPVGAHIINVGRGSLIVEADLVAALDAGHIASATLDVTATEPLPPDDPLWADPRVLITSHSAAASIPGPAARYVVDVIRQLEAGETPANLYVPDRGY